MKIKRKFVVIAGISVVCLAAIILLFSNKKVIEQVKRETAKITKQEFIPNQNIDISTCLVTEKKDSIYQDFRKKFRFHCQNIGVATFADSSRMILISEPPPYFSMDSIKSIFSKFSFSVETRKHKMGYDGFAVDIIISMVNASNENIDNLTQKLSKTIYLSDYKPYIINLPIQNPKVYFTSSNIDYQITLYEFNEWFLEDKEQFFTLTDTNTVYTVEDFFAKKKSGVFFSKLPGFVAWCLPKNHDIKSQISDIRKFTLDADLVLGALADSNMLVIIGREREAPLNELAPLNVESVLLLASISEKELSQSLDVNDFLAGKMGNGRDWCPTYLSKELENTEFGHLMTITDILLKDWSERGTIDEYNYRYPTPGYYPFDKPLFKKLGIQELVYNWNTANTMYAIDLEKATIYTLNRTGSLPVSYFNSPESGISIGSSYEEKAYAYFATCGNTDLARVVQYTALYQLFMDNGITYSGDVHTAFPKNKPYLLLTPTKNLLTIFKNFKDNEITYLCDSVTERNYNLYIHEKINEELTKNEKKYNFLYSEEERERIKKDIFKDQYDNLKDEFIKVRRILSQLSEEEFNKMAKQLAYPRGQRINSREDYNLMLKGRIVRELLNHIGKKNLDLINLDLNEVKNYFVNHLSGSAAPYLKTPSIIVTYNDLTTTGGHNLSSKINRVHSLQNYKQKPRHNYDYAEERSNRDCNPQGTVPEVQKSSTPSSSSPQTTPSKGQPTSKSVPSTKGNVSKTSTSSHSTTPTKISTNKPATRPRSNVIPTTTRTQRGF